jgi:hypothetical protein
MAREDDYERNGCYDMLGFDMDSMKPHERMSLLCVGGIIAASVRADVRQRSR